MVPRPWVRSQTAAMLAVCEGGQAMTPYYRDDYITLWHGDCREIVPTLGKF